MFILLLASCEDAVFIGDDASFIADAGVVDAGFNDAEFNDAGFITDAGSLDAGFPDEDKCDGSLETSPWPCEEDADFCDTVGEQQSKRDIVSGWSHREADTFVIDLRMSAAPFVRGPHFEADICILEEGEDADVELSCVGPCSRIYGIEEYAFGTIPRDFVEISQQDPFVVESLDVCSSVFLSTDGRTLRLKLPAFTVDPRWAPIVYLADGCETVDGLDPSAGVTSRAGQQDDTQFLSVCDVQCTE